MKIIIGDKQGYKINGSMKFLKYVEHGPDYTEPFYVENITDSNETLSIKKSQSSTPTITIEISSDRTNWSTLGTTSTTAITRALLPGEKLYMRASINSWATGAATYNSIAGMSKVGGNTMSLLYGSRFTGDEVVFPSSNTFVLGGLFNGVNSLLDASKLLLPAITLNINCYNSMFKGCTSLTTPPVLPATTLANYCYSMMFNGCTSLTTTPILPATVLGMGSYYRMFMDCTSLTTAHVLPATTLTNYCYEQMFWSCTNLNYITCLATDISAGGTNNWVNGVAATGTFYKKAGVTWPSGASGIPEGWIVTEV